MIIFLIKPFLLVVKYFRKFRSLNSKNLYNTYRNKTLLNYVKTPISPFTKIAQVFFFCMFDIYSPLNFGA